MGRDECGTIVYIHEKHGTTLAMDSTMIRLADLRNSLDEMLVMAREKLTQSVSDL